MIKLTCVLIVSTLLVSPSLANEALTGAQLKDEVSGHTFKWNSAKYNASGVSHYNADGSETLTLDGGKGPENGKWRIKGNQLCDKVGKNKETCSKVSRVDDKTTFWEAYQSTAVRQD
jgi:hypothetical protein